MKHIRNIAAACLILLGSMAAPAATSVSFTMTHTERETTFTWTFDGDHTTGTYVNGDPWVVGPVTITAITPADPDPSNYPHINGSTINPIANEHGLDSRISNSSTYWPTTISTRYKIAKNIARQLPYTVQPGSTVMSAESDMAYNGNLGILYFTAILTVVAEAPAEGSFRPNWYGPNKYQFNESQMNYDVLPDLEPTPNSPSPVTNEGFGTFRYHLLDLQTGGGEGNTNFKSYYNNAKQVYGRELAKQTNRMWLALCLNYTNEQKRVSLIRAVQRGIDTYGAHKQGYVPPAMSGHNDGRIINMYMAGRVLGDDDMVARFALGVGPKSSEHGQFGYITQKQITDTAPMKYGAKYIDEHMGMPEWGGSTFGNQEDKNMVSDWRGYRSGYRYIGGTNGIPFVLLLHFMNGYEHMNHPAMVDYIVTRYYPIEYLRLPYDTWLPGNPIAPNETISPHTRDFGGVNHISRGEYELWNAYGPLVAPPPEPEPDETAPTVTGAAINSAGNRLTVQFSESVTNVNTAHYTLSGGFSLTAFSGGGATHIWSISPIVTSADTVTLAFTSGSGRTQDAAGNLLETFSGFAVQNNSLEVTPDPPRAGRRGRAGGENVPFSR